LGNIESLEKIAEALNNLELDFKEKIEQKKYEAVEEIIKILNQLQADFNSLYEENMQLKNELKGMEKYPDIKNILEENKALKAEVEYLKKRLSACEKIIGITAKTIEKVRKSLGMQIDKECLQELHNQGIKDLKVNEYISSDLSGEAFVSLLKARSSRNF